MHDCTSPYFFTTLCTLFVTFRKLYSFRRARIREVVMSRKHYTEKFFFYFSAHQLRFEYNKRKFENNVRICNTSTIQTKHHIKLNGFPCISYGLDNYTCILEWLRSKH